MRKNHRVRVGIGPDTLRYVREMSRRSDRSVGQVSSALIEEAVKMRRCPGIIFTDGPTGRRATVAGSGIDVWEVIRVSKAGASRREIARTFPRLSPGQIDAAFMYHACFSPEIARRIQENEAPFGTLHRRSPFIKKVRV